MVNQRPKLILHLTSWLLPSTILIANALLFWFGCGGGRNGVCDLAHSVQIADVLRYTPFALLIGLIMTSLYVIAISTMMQIFLDLFDSIANEHLRHGLILVGGMAAALLIGVLQFLFVPQLIIALGLVPSSMLQITVFELGIVWSMGGFGLVGLLTIISMTAVGNYLRQLEHSKKRKRRSNATILRLYTQTK